MAKRGHTNANTNAIREWQEVEKYVEAGIARIPISGGASPGTIREFPPLALTKDEWEEIGRKMGWHV